MPETIPLPLTLDPSTRRLRLDPHDPRFYQDPYASYAWLHGQGGVFLYRNTHNFNDLRPNMQPPTTSF